MRNPEVGVDRGCVRVTRSDRKMFKLVDADNRNKSLIINNISQGYVVDYCKEMG